jgi:hypothetical protein
MYTSSAEPFRLSLFGLGVQPVADDLGTGATSVETAMSAFTAGAGDFAPVTSAIDWTAPLRSLRDEVAFLGSWTARVGGWFRDAGADTDGDGVFGTDDEGALSAVLGSPVLAEERLRLAAALATLHERTRSGESGMTQAEVALLLGQVRSVISASDDPRAEAELLTATMGAGDVVAALLLLEPGAHDGSSAVDVSVAALRDLGHLLSLGLEDQPERAERWADEILTEKVASGPVWDIGSSVESVAVMGSGNAAGTSMVTGALYSQLINRTGSSPRGGLVDRLYGVTAPGAPILVTAAAVDAQGCRPQASLAHEVVSRTLEAGAMRQVFDRDAGTGAFESEAGRRYQAQLREVLVASVDMSIDRIDRQTLAYELTDAFVAARSLPLVGDAFSADVTRGFAGATQPLLESWTGAAGGSVEGGWSRGLVPDDLLWEAVGHFAEAPGGVAGLQDAVEGMTTVRLGELAIPERAAAGGDLGPYDGTDLVELGETYQRLAYEVGNERFNSLVDAAEQGVEPDDASLSVAYGVIGEAPGGSTLAGVIEGLRGFADEGPEVTGGNSPIEGLELRLTRDLILQNLAADPVLGADPHLGTVLEQVSARQGVAGLHDLVHGSQHALNDEAGPGLTRLRDLVRAQEATVNLAVARMGAELTEVDDAGD